MSVILDCITRKPLSKEAIDRFNKFGYTKESLLSLLRHDYHDLSRLDLSVSQNALGNQAEGLKLRDIREDICNVEFVTPFDKIFTAGAGHGDSLYVELRNDTQVVVPMFHGFSGNDVSLYYTLLRLNCMFFSAKYRKSLMTRDLLLPLWLTPNGSEYGKNLVDVDIRDKGVMRMQAIYLGDGFSIHSRRLVFGHLLNRPPQLL